MPTSLPHARILWRFNRTGKWRYFVSLEDMIDSVETSRGPVPVFQSQNYGQTWRLFGGFQGSRAMASQRRTKARSVSA